MTDQKTEKVYLLPRTIDYYQKELTRLLEFERYMEAAAMLRFLLDCDTADSGAKAEWQGILDGLNVLFPEIREGEGSFPAEEEEEEEQTEEDMLRHHTRERAAQDPEYVRKLLEVFRRPADWEKQVLALEQLRHLEHPELEPVLRRWLEEQPLPPSLQFRAMQLLKLKGAEGKVKLRRSGRVRRVNLSDVPTRFEEYPIPFQEILARVSRSGAREGFPLNELAERTWEEFVAYSFASPPYLDILTAGVEEWDAWAAAFHCSLLLAAQGEADVPELLDTYGITENLEPVFTKACTVFKEFSRTVFPSFH